MYSRFNGPQHRFFEDDQKGHSQREGSTMNGLSRNNREVGQTTGEGGNLLYTMDGTGILLVRSAPD